MGILAGLLGERRDHPSNPKNWLLYGLSGGNQTYTGKAVNEDNALESSAVWAAVRILAETIASLPLHLYKRVGRGKERAVNHPLYPLLHIRPNSEMTTMAYREAQMGQVLLYGFAVSEISYDGNMKIDGLWPLLSRNAEIKRLNGEMKCVYRLPDGGTATFPRDRFLYVPGFSKNGLAPYKPVFTHKESLGLTLALEEYAARFFGNGAKPPVVIEHPTSLGPEGHDLLKKSWQEAQGGLSNAHRIAILEEGMKLHEYGTNPKDSQAIESRQFQLEEVARIFNIPPHMLRDLSRSTYSNIETQSLEFVIYSLTPWLVRFEQNYTTQLLSDKEQKKYFWEHLVDGLLRGDTASRWQAYTHGFNMGVWSPNDILEMENKNGYEGGDQHFVQLNMVPVENAGEQLEPVKPEPEEPPEGDSLPGPPEIRASDKKRLTGIDRAIRSFRPLIRKAAQRVINRETLAIKREAAKQFSERGVQSFEAWMEAFEAEHAGYIESTLGPVLRTYQEMVAERAGSIIGVEIGAGDLERFYQDTIENYVYRHVKSSSGQVAEIVKTVDQQGLLDALTKRMDEWYKKRADKIAADEAVRLANAVSRETWTRHGYTKLRWVTLGTNCPFCSALAGRVVGVQEAFFDAGDVLYVQGDKMDILGADGQYKVQQIKQRAGNVQALKVYRTKMHAPIHQGCDCRILPVK